MSSIRQQTIHSAKWAAVEKFTVQGINFVMGLILARILCPDDFGLVGMLSIFFAISQTFIDSGFANALIRKKECSEEDYSTAFLYNIFISLLCYVILFVIAPWVADFFKIPVLCSILRVQSVSIVISSLMGVQTAMLTRNLDFKSLAKRAAISSFISGFVGIILAYYGWGVWAIVYQGILNNAINMVAVWYYCNWVPKTGFSKDSFHELFSYGNKLLASGLLNTLYSNLTTLLIGRFFTAKDLGYYSRGTQFATYPVSNINGVLSRVSFPILAKIQDDDEKLIQAYRQYVSISSMLIFFACSLLAALAEPLIRLILTDKWLDSVIYLQIYSFAIMFDHINGFNLNLLQVKGRSDLFLRLEIIKKSISTLILFSSIPFGVIGICISKIVYSQIAVFINTYYTGKIFGLGYVEQLRDFSKYFFLSVVSVLPYFMFSSIDINDFVKISLGIITSISIYIVLLRNDSYYLQILTLLKRFFKR